jgi:hypothetical protein
MVLDPAGRSGAVPLKPAAPHCAALAKVRIIHRLEAPMHRATNVQFERAVAEYVRWRTVPEDDRSPAPAWWWGPAFEVRELEQPMPADWCVGLQLPDGSSFADGAGVFLKALADQTWLPWPDDFPGKAKPSNPA